MNALMGTYKHTIDAKGRMAFPAKLREVTGDRFVVTSDPSGCLFAYSETQWDELTEKLRTLTGAVAKAAVRRIFANACIAEADAQGRILIPKELRAFASLEKNVTIIGNLNHAEIWDSEKYEEAQNKFTDEELAAALDEISF